MVDIETNRRLVADALRDLESKVERLVDSLGHQQLHAVIEGAADDSDAVRRACTAYSAISYQTHDEVEVSPRCLGVLGVASDLLQRAAAVNEAKAAFRAVCTPLQRVFVRIPVKGEDGPTQPIPAIRLILRNLQKSDVNLLAAYRRIPILDAPPTRITYTRAFTRAVYRKSIEDIERLIANFDGSDAIADRARLMELHPSEPLALAKERYENIRANILLRRLDPRGRGRIQIAAELPLMYSMGRQHQAPEIHFPAANESGGPAPHPRKTKLEPLPYLKSLPVYRYLARAG